MLMTALCAGLALTPLLFGADEPGREILHPVAVTIFGGLLSATTARYRPDPHPLSDVRREAAASGCWLNTAASLTPAEAY